MLLVKSNHEKRQFRQMQVVYSDQCTDVSTLGHWVRQFKNGEIGKQILIKKSQSGRPVTENDQFHQDRIEELIHKN